MLKNRWGSYKASSFHQACQASDGSLTVNGAALRTFGRCACKCRMYSPIEAKFGACVDCSAEVKAELRGEGVQERAA